MLNKNISLDTSSQPIPAGTGLQSFSLSHEISKLPPILRSPLFLTVAGYLLFLGAMAAWQISLPAPALPPEPEVLPVQPTVTVLPTTIEGPLICQRPAILKSDLPIPGADVVEENPTWMFDVIPDTAFNERRLEREAQLERERQQKLLLEQAAAVSNIGPIEFRASDLQNQNTSKVKSYAEINPDVKGWIRIPNTNIDYPIVQGKDNESYSNLDVFKNQSKNGCIWADCAAKFGSSSQISKNTVLFGHNWTNYSSNPIIAGGGVMFAQLTSFHHLAFAKATPYIEYSTQNQDMVFQVFAAFYTTTDFQYVFADPNSSTFGQIISKAKGLSLHDYDVDVSTSDKILTLSTCTRARGSSPSQRFVVMARLLRSGESYQKATSIS